MLALDFSKCKTFLLSFDFIECNLSFSVFDGLRVPNTRFKKCILQEASFYEVDLNKSSIIECDLYGVSFENCVLKTADFSNSYNLEINPEINQIDAIKIDVQNLPGLLKKYNLNIQN